MATLGPAGAQALTTLYGARPPSGSSYIRVVNPLPAPASVKIAAGAATTISSKAVISTGYKIVPGNRPVTIAIDGKPAKTTITPPPDVFLTLVMHPAAGGDELTTITDDAGDVDGLRAQLRFYNLVPGCSGGVSLEAGQAVFEAVAVNETKARIVNPIQATLRPRCGATLGPARKLPMLKAGDRYSIFLIGDPAHPVMAGNVDATEPYQSK